MSRRRITMSTVAAGLTVLLLLTGCGASSDDRATSSSAQKAPAQPGAQQDGGAAQAKVPEKLETEPRAIIRTGTIAVRVSNVDDAATRAAALATGIGGFVGGEQRHSDDRRSQAQLVLRVPADKFDSVLEGLRQLGNEENRSVSTEDVTEQVVDVDTRIANAQASVDRIRALVARAQTISEITSLEGELSRREADLESLRARKRKLDALTALSTITANLLGPQAALDKEQTGFLAGLAGGWSAFTTSMVVLLTVLGALLPWLVALGAPTTVLVWLLRRRRNRAVRAPDPAEG